MATVTAALSINSADVLTSNLALTVNTVINCDSGALIRAKVKATTHDSDALKIYTLNQCNDRAYVYLRNLDLELEQYVYIYNNTAGASDLVAKVGGGEFAFVPVAADKSYAVYATKVDTMIEYGIFGNDNSSVPITGAGA